MRFPAVSLVVVAAILTFPPPAAAQEPVRSFDQLNTRLKPGDTVYVTDAQGREIKGKIRSINATSLSLDGDTAPTFKAIDVRTIVERRPDSLKNGMIIGAVSGFAAAAGLIVAACSSDDCDYAGPAILAGLSTGAGAGIGAGIDATIKGPKRVVYRAQVATASAQLSLVPLVSPRVKGVAVSFAF
jgi:hypothetical protein